MSVQAASPAGEIVLSPRPAPLVRTLAPAAHTMAVAAGGVLAGAALVGLASRRARGGRALARRTSRGGRARRAVLGRGGGPRTGLEILATRSLLVDIHLLGRPGAER